MLITIDPGHGGTQPGAVGKFGLKEKDVCLTVSRLVREMLQGSVEVVLTRDTDINIVLSRRLPIPGSAAYISIHCNGFTDRAANGTECFFQRLPHRSPQSLRLAQRLQDHLLRHLGLRNRGVKEENFQVLRQSPRVPAVLAELAFITNIKEEILLGSVRGQEQAARGVADGIRAFLHLGGLS